MNISELFTKNNIKILRIIAKEEIHIREIAEKLNISPATVHNFAKKLKKEKLIEEVNVKNKVVLKLKKTNSLIMQAISILNYNDFVNTKAYKKLKKIGNTGIYGSYAEGTNDSESDIDLWIKTKESELKIRPLIRELEHELKTKVNPLVLTEEKLKKIRKEDPEFYIRLKLTSKGDEFDE